MKTIIHASISPGRGAGGVETVLIALIKALGKQGGDDEYLIVCQADAVDFFKPFVGPNSRIIARDFESKAPRTSSFVRWVLSPVKHRLVPQLPKWSFPRVSDGFLEDLEADVIHFPCQDFTICGIPSIYSPHDLQHRHFPQFFSPASLVWREETYRKGCDYSKAIIVGSQFVKDDITMQFGTSPSKIQVIPLAPPCQAYAEPDVSAIDVIKARYRLGRPFILYPAMTWPHKNHLRLIDAFASSQAAAEMDLICTGYRNDFFPTIERRAREKKVEERVRFLGLVSGEDLRAIYRLCQFVVIPTLFESTSEPIFEAWEASKAVACSNVTALPEQTAGAALLFDPYDTMAIAHAIDAMQSQGDHYARLGQARLETFSWERSAQAYRALYRKVAGGKLTVNETKLLATDWMLCQAA